MIESTIAGILRERAHLQPRDLAFTYVDYDRDAGGTPDSLTWADLHRRVVNLADDLRTQASHGDRALILAPQGLDYVVGYLGALEANLIAVPLAAPVHESGDERVRAVLVDAAPTVIVTTAALVDAVVRCIGDIPAPPAIVEIDRLDLTTPRRLARRREDPADAAYLQYTSGSTRSPAGVMVSHRNLSANFEQMTGNFFADHGGVAPPGTTVVSWLPFYHDMGLLLGICTPILGGWQTVFTSPVAFLTQPARWISLLGSHRRGLTAAPNFAFDLASARTSDAELAGCNLGDVLAIMSGAERVQPASVERFAARFAPFGLSERVIRPSYGLAEATLYVATRAPGDAPSAISFDPSNLSRGLAVRSAEGTPLISYGVPTSPSVRIVDPESCREVEPGSIGEIWTRGDNVCLGYWNKPAETAHTFGGVLDDSGDTWLRTGDLGFLCAGELFIVGRLKDLLIVRGRNHYPDDIEATVSEISGGRSAAIAVERGGTEALVVVAEVKADRDIAGDVTAAVADAHGLTISELVLVARGSLPITTSGKIRRRRCAEQYLTSDLVRLDA